MKISFHFSRVVSATRREREKYETYQRYLSLGFLVLVVWCGTLLCMPTSSMGRPMRMDELLDQLVANDASRSSSFESLASRAEAKEVYYSNFGGQDGGYLVRVVEEEPLSNLGTNDDDTQSIENNDNMNGKTARHGARRDGYNEKSRHYSLDLCDCEPAQGDPGHLSCSKEGFFISDFERQGEWMAGGGSVPLSRAICCRPCLPEKFTRGQIKELKEQGNQGSSEWQDYSSDSANHGLPKELIRALSLGSQPVAVVSLGCHGSTDALSLRCEASADSFVVRFGTYLSLFLSFYVLKCIDPCLLFDLREVMDNEMLIVMHSLFLETLLHSMTVSPPNAFFENKKHSNSQTGFTQAIKVFSAPAFYPIDTAHCCTPALLLDDGSSWELERCGCHSSEDSDKSVNCNGETTGELLAGFDYFRLSPMGQIIPIGPSKCCGVCVTAPTNSSSDPHPKADCSELNYCNRHGVCILGRCECRPGWGGSDCSYPLSGKGGSGSMPPWAIVAIVIGSCVVVLMILIIAGNVVEVMFEGRDGNDGGSDSLRRPILDGIDDNDIGSVGSQDTDEEALEGIEERIEGMIRRLDDAAEETSAREADTSPNDENITQGQEGNDSEDRANSERSEVNQTEDGNSENTRSQNNAQNLIPQRRVAATTNREEDAASSFENSARIRNLDTVIQQGQNARDTTGERENTNVEGRDAENQVGTAQESPQIAGDTPLESIESPQKPPPGSTLDSYAGVGPLASVDCSVCMIRPVQTVLVPCGHVCMCRRCSRRLQRCPVCRTEIIRRQRLFV